MKINIIEDINGRVPFAVVGIFLLIGSSITSTIIINLENKLSGEISISLGVGEIDSMLSSMQADLATALNYAAMRAMDYVGKHPIIRPIDTKVAEGYYGKEIETTEKFSTFEEMKNFNMNWTRNITRVYFNEYIVANYMYDAFNNGKYAINVVAEGKEPIKDWRKIKVKEIYMSIDRQLDSFRDLFTTSSDGFAVIYWEFSVLLDIEIKDLKSNEIIAKREINVSTLATSRLPILMKLVWDYESSINSLSSTLLFTLMSQVFTEGRALVQYGGMKNEVPNIVDNRWLTYLTNVWLMFEQFLVFNSIDPFALANLALNVDDLVAKGYPELAEAQQMFMSDNLLGGLNINIENNLLDVISRNDKSKKEQVNNYINNPKPKENINITRLAEDILNKAIYTYYYYNNKTGELKPIHEFRGYNFTENDVNYIFVHPPPYVYENKTYKKIEIRKDKFEPNYKFESNGFTYEYVPSTEIKGYEREVLQQLNDTLLQEMEKVFYEVYSETFYISMSREKIDEGYISEPEGDCIVDEGDWEYYSATSTEYVEKGDVIENFPYVEEWIVEWRKEEIWGKEVEIKDAEGHVIGYKCQGNDKFIKYKKEKVILRVNVNFRDIDKLYSYRNVEVFNRKDYNLYNISKDFVKRFVENRTKLLKNEITSSTISLPSSPSSCYAMNWLKGIHGEVAKALYDEIFKEIKRDGKTILKVEISSETNYKEKEYNELIDEHVSQLLNKFKGRMDHYINDSKYRNKTTGNYLSCGAKVVATIRKWYVEEIEKKLQEIANKMKNEIKNNIDRNLDKHVDENTKQKIEEIQEKKGNVNVDIHSLPPVQFGLTISLEGKWKEEIGFSINQDPDYFTYKGLSSNDLYRFKVKNICLFGPTGLPVLPTPVTPWVITINTWYIEVQGEFAKFEVTDTVGEMHPDILFGNVGSCFVREERLVKDEICSGEFIGYVCPIKFRIYTINFAITPPSFIGDMNPTSYPVEKDPKEGW